MSIKKELLNELTDYQLKELAKSKGIKFKSKNTEKTYYAEWDEREMMIDFMSNINDLTVPEIERFIKAKSFK